MNGDGTQEMKNFRISDSYFIKKNIKKEIKQENLLRCNYCNNVSNFDVINKKCNICNRYLKNEKKIKNKKEICNQNDNKIFNLHPLQENLRYATNKKKFFVEKEKIYLENNIESIIEIYNNNHYNSNFTPSTEQNTSEDFCKCIIF